MVILTELDQLLLEMLDGIEPGIHLFELLCDPKAFSVIQSAAVRCSYITSVAQIMDSGNPRQYGWARIHLSPDMQAGHYEFHENGKCVKAGVLDAATV